MAEGEEWRPGYLPDECLCLIFSHISSPQDRRALALSCRRFYRLDGQQCRTLRVSKGLHPANEALARLSVRFSGLRTVEVNYLGWTPAQGPQINDGSLQVLIERCPHLEDLLLSFCTFVTDSGLAHLSGTASLRSLSLNFTPGVTGRGLLSVVSGCQLESLRVELCMSVRSSEWLEYLGRNQEERADRPPSAGGKCGARRRALRELTVINCRGIGEGDLVKLGKAWQQLEGLTFEADKEPREQLLWPLVDFSMLEVDLRSLRLMNLKRCPQKPGQGLASVLTSCCGLRSLSLDSCPSMLCRDLEIVLSNCRSLESLLLRVEGHNSISKPGTLASNYGLDSLLLIASYCTGLRSLTFDVQHLIRASWESAALIESTIGVILQNCKDLHYLSLGHVPFTMSGWQAIAKWPSLRQLWLKAAVPLMGSDRQEGDFAFPFLEELHLNKCCSVTNEMLLAIVATSRLKVMQVAQCARVTAKGEALIKEEGRRRGTDVHIQLELLTPA